MPKKTAAKKARKAHKAVKRKPQKASIAKALEKSQAKKNAGKLQKRPQKKPLRKPEKKAASRPALKKAVSKTAKQKEGKRKPAKKATKKSKPIKKAFLKKGKKPGSQKKSSAKYDISPIISSTKKAQLKGHSRKKQALAGYKSEAASKGKNQGIKKESPENRIFNLHNLELMIIFIALVALFLGFFAFVGEMQLNNNNSQENFFEKILEDKQINSSELSFLLSLGCDDVKKLLRTDRDVCLYVTDYNGNIVELSPGVYGIGCKGVVVKGKKVCG